MCVHIFVRILLFVVLTKRQAVIVKYITNKSERYISVTCIILTVTLMEDWNYWTWATK